MSFYNPYSKYPDVSGGIQDLLNQYLSFMMLKKMFPNQNRAQMTQTNTPTSPLQNSTLSKIFGDTMSQPSLPSQGIQGTQGTGGVNWGGGQGAGQGAQGMGGMNMGSGSSGQMDPQMMQMIMGMLQGMKGGGAGGIL